MARRARSLCWPDTALQTVSATQYSGMQGVVVFLA